MSDERTLYHLRCGWCGAYEGVVDEGELCPDSTEDNMHPHQFGIYERAAALLAEPQGEDRKHERAVKIASAASDAIWGGELGWAHDDADIDALIATLRKRLATPPIWVPTMNTWTSTGDQP